MKPRGPLSNFLLTYYFSCFSCIIFNNCPSTGNSFSRDDNDDDQVAKSAATNSPGQEAAVEGLHGLCSDNTDCFDDSSNPPDQSTRPNEAAAAEMLVHESSVATSFGTEAQAVEGSSTGDSDERPKPSDALTLAGACFVLLINIPVLGTVESRLLILYYAHITLLGLALLLSIGLYVFSICDDDGSSGGGRAYRRVMKARKRTTMAAAVSLVVASIMLRVVVTLPAATTKHVLPLFLGGAVLLLGLGTLYCLLGSRAEASTTGQLPLREASTTEQLLL